MLKRVTSLSCPLSAAMYLWFFCCVHSNDTHESKKIMSPKASLFAFTCRYNSWQANSMTSGIQGPGPGASYTGGNKHEQPLTLSGRGLMVNPVAQDRVCVSGYPPESQPLFAAIGYFLVNSNAIPGKKCTFFLPTTVDTTCCVKYWQ